jgi:hypothetical protein
LVRADATFDALYTFVRTVASVETSNPRAQASLVRHDAERMRTLWCCTPGSVELRASESFAARHVMVLRDADKRESVAARAEARAAASATLRAELPGVLKHFVRLALLVAVEDVLLRLRHARAPAAALTPLAAMTNEVLCNTLAMLASLTMHMPVVPTSTRGVSKPAFDILASRYGLYFRRLRDARQVRGADGATKWVLGV